MSPPFIKGGTGTGQGRRDSAGPFENEKEILAAIKQTLGTPENRNGGNLMRLAGTHPCATVDCPGMATGNTRWCRTCRIEAATPQVRHADIRAMAELVEDREQLAGWHMVSARRSGHGSPWWWR